MKCITLTSIDRVFESDTRLFVEIFGGASFPHFCLCENRRNQKKNINDESICEFYSVVELNIQVMISALTSFFA